MGSIDKINKDGFIALCDQNLKLVRTEYSLTQDKMALILGISKKTLVEVEKGRRSLGWSGAVCLSSIFCESAILKNIFGGEPSDLILSLAFRNMSPSYPKTMGGKVWWKNIKHIDGFKIQKNIISCHYRLLNEDDCRIISSFDLEEVKARLREEIGR